MIFRILAIHNAKDKLDFTHPYRLLRQLSEIFEESVGGTSGAVKDTRLDYCKKRAFFSDLRCNVEHCVDRIQGVGIERIMHFCIKTGK